MRKQVPKGPSILAGEGSGRGDRTGRLDAGLSEAQRSNALCAAKHSRTHPTDAEHRLWQLLRAKRLDNWKFRRQPPIGPYRPDFVCFGARLIVEADGGQHGPERDQRRDAWLMDQGFRILRFWNNDILSNEGGVLTAILCALEGSVAASSHDGATPLPNPSPTEGEGL